MYYPMGICYLLVTARIVVVVVVVGNYYSLSLSFNNYNTTLCNNYCWFEVSYRFPPAFSKSCDLFAIEVPKQHNAIIITTTLQIIDQVEVLKRLGNSTAFLGLEEDGYIKRITKFGMIYKSNSTIQEVKKGWSILKLENNSSSAPWKSPNFISDAYDSGTNQAAVFYICTDLCIYKQTH